jgi:PAS domain-containing protein
LTPYPPCGGCAVPRSCCIISENRQTFSSMDDIRQFSGIIGSLYDCVPDPARWQQTLQGLCDRFDCVMATLAVLDASTNQSRFGAWCGDPDLVMPLITKYAADMPFYGVFYKSEIDIPMQIETLYEFYGPGGREAHLNSRMYREWSEPNGIEDCFGLTVMKQDNRFGALSLVTHKSRPAIHRDELDALGLLAPHVRRAVTIGDLFETEQRENHIFQDVIDSLNFAVLVVGADMKLHYANPVAEAMLRDGSILTAPMNTLAFESQIAHSAIRKAVITGERDEVALGTAGIGVPLAPVQRPAIAHVLPLFL